MGQYHKVVNLDKMEYINHYALGAGAKLVEQIWQKSLVGNALMILLACSNDRGGGDIALNDYTSANNPDDVFETKITPIKGREKWKNTIGRWAGDRIVMIGDYAENGDFKTTENDPELTRIYELCGKRGGYKDVSKLVLPIVEYCCDAKVKKPPHRGSWMDVEYN